MLRQILVGAAVSVCNIAIHTFFMAAAIWAARIGGAITTSRQSLHLIAVMIMTVSFLMAAHLAEVLVCAAGASNGTRMSAFGPHAKSGGARFRAAVGV